VLGPNPVPRRRPTLGEEIANAVSHGVGLLAALIAVPLLIMSAVHRGGVSGVLGASVFATAIVLMYSASTLYHALPPNRAKRVFRALDHGAIYLLIAGTYTPFTLGILRGPWGWTLFGIVWALALTGILFKTLGKKPRPHLSTTFYLSMGWIILIAAKPLLEHMPAWGLFWLVAGGLAYTTGVGFYVAERFRYSHFIWHLFVIAGTSCHFIAVQWYAT